MTTTYKGWYLLDHHKNRTRPEGGVAGDPHTKPWYTSRRTCQIRAVSEPIQEIPERGSPSVYALLTIRGRRVPA